jgi:hypothetical protein
LQASGAGWCTIGAMLVRRLAPTGDYTDTDWTNPATPPPDNARAIKLVDSTLEVALQGKASDADDAAVVDVGGLLVDAYLVTKVGEGFVRGPSIGDLINDGDPVSGKMLLRFPDVARGTTVYLHLALTGVQAAAVAATGTVSVTSTPGGNLAGGEVLTLDAAEFTVDGAIAIPAATPTSVAVTASVAGAAGNTAAGEILTFTAPPADIDEEALVEEPGLAGGLDALPVVDVLLISGGRVL